MFSILEIGKKNQNFVFLKKYWKNSLLFHKIPMH